MVRQFVSPDAWNRMTQQVNTANEATRNKGGSGWRPPFYFSDHGDLVRFFAGEYGPERDFGLLNYQVWVPGARDGKGMHIPCNCKSGTLDVPCVPCHYIEKDRKRGDRPKLFVSVATAINLVHLAPYHKVKVDTNGNRPSPNYDGRTYTRYYRCDGPGCEMCKANDPQFFGNTSYAQFFNKEWNMFLGFGRTIGYNCLSCEPGKIVPTASRCPKCQREFDAPIKLLRKMEVEGGYCQHCGYNGIFSFAKDCMVKDHATGDWHQGCGNPKSASVFDVNCEIARKKTGEKSYQLEMASFDFDEIPDDILKKMKYPMKLDFLERMDPAMQAKHMGVPNPFEGKQDLRPSRERPQSSFQDDNRKFSTGTNMPVESSPMQEAPEQSGNVGDELDSDFPF